MVRWYGTATLIKQRDSLGVEINSNSYFNRAHSIISIFIKIAKPFEYTPNV